MKFNFLVAIFLLFLIQTKAQTLTSSNLPIVLIQTDLSAEIPDDPKILASMKVIFRPDGSRNYVTDQNNAAYLNYDGRIGIELRGSSSQALPKKPYSLTTLQNDNVTNNNVSLLGMPSENDWVLNSLAFDPALIRDYLSYELSRSIGQYAARGQYCEVVLNGTYIGLYILMEKLKIDSDRINILKMTNADNSLPNLTGGFIVKADKTTGGDPVAWNMGSYNGGTDYIYDNPDPSDITTQQGNYIKNQFFALETDMSANNASITNGYPTIIDVPTFIDYMLINEISANVDAYQFSTFFHKDRNGKLRAGPVWDSNLTYGNDLFLWGLDRSFTNVWQFDNGDNTGSYFWKDLYDNSTYKCYLTKRWRELNASNQPLNYTVISNKINSIVSLITEATGREQTKWGTVGNLTNNISSLKTWLQARIAWMNGQLSNYTACVSPNVPPLVISKIDFNPVAVQGLTSNNMEFIEITNNGSQGVNLTGIYFGELGISYQFPSNSTIPGNGKIYLASNATTFQQLYGAVPFGQFTRNLSNNSQKLKLVDAFGNVIDYVEYLDAAPWYPQADGGGYFLEIKNFNANHNLASNWTISSNMILDIDVQEDNSAVNIFPNPGKSNIKIETGNIEVVSYEIYDLNGKKVFSKNDINSYSFDINIDKLVKGTYILRLYHQKGVLVNKISKI